MIRVTGLKTEERHQDSPCEGLADGNCLKSYMYCCSTTSPWF